MDIPSFALLISIFFAPHFIKSSITFYFFILSCSFLLLKGAFFRIPCTYLPSLFGRSTLTLPYEKISWSPSQDIFTGDNACIASSGALVLRPSMFQPLLTTTQTLQR
jgi:hypothetical protein